MTDLHITGPNGDGEYWLHIKAGGKMGGFNLGSEHGPLAHRLLDAAAIEAPAQKPVAWRWRICYREEWCWSVTKPMFSPRDLEQGTVFDVQPLYDTPPDALALVAAAYRDAVDWLISAGMAADASVDPLSRHILARTPADAEAHLTALLRAEYERGVRDAAARIADTCPHADVPGGNCTPDTFDEGTSAAYEAVLALLTQEGR